MNPLVKRYILSRGIQVTLVILLAAVGLIALSFLPDAALVGIYAVGVAARRAEPAVSHPQIGRVILFSGRATGADAFSNAPASVRGDSLWPG